MSVAPSALPSRETLLQEVNRRRDAIQKSILRWAPGAERHYPWRQTGRSPYEILVAEVLLKRTTSTAAARVYEHFLDRFPSFESVVSARQKDLETALSTVGLQHQRAVALKEMASFVVQQWDGHLPEDAEQLESVPHIGPYAAGAVRSFAFGRPAAIVDSNVERIIRRLFQESLPPRPSLPLLRLVAEQLLSRRSHRRFNLGLLDLGALVCRYDRPRCGECPLLGDCDFGRGAI